MFNLRLIRSLEAQVSWQQKQIELLESKLFIATRLQEVKIENTTPKKYDTVSKSMVEMTPEEIHKNSQALAELLSMNENPVA